MRTSYRPFVPVDETATPLTSEEREVATRRYRVLDLITEAIKIGDIETVKALAATL